MPYPIPPQEPESLTFGEAQGVAQSPANAIALALVLLDRIAVALEDMAEKDY